MVIHIINGPNLNLVGKREPEVYGNRSLDQYLQELTELFPQHTIDVFQSNIEGEIVDRLQQVGFDDCGIICCCCYHRPCGRGPHQQHLCA